jgi:hypothetical protein
VGPRKRRPILGEDRVREVFSDTQTSELAQIGKLPERADLARLAKIIREAASDYIRDARTPNANELHDEIEALYNAAHEKHHERAAKLIQDLSRDARALLVERGRRPGLAIGLPFPKDLRDPAKRDAACDSVLALCIACGRWIEGRRLASGRRSPQWQPVLYGPKRSPNFPKRKAELDFIWKLQGAVLDVTTGPFALMVRKCFKLLEARDASAVDLINELNRRARAWEKTRGIDRQPAQPKTKRGG